MGLGRGSSQGAQPRWALQRVTCLCICFQLSECAAERRHLRIVSPEPCDVVRLPAGSPSLAVAVTVQVDTPVCVDDALQWCVRVQATSPDSEVWHYDVPPTPISNIVQDAFLCKEREQASCQMTTQLTLPAGFVKLRAQLCDPSGHPLFSRQDAEAELSFHIQKRQTRENDELMKLSEQLAIKSKALQDKAERRHTEARRSANYTLLHPHLATLDHSMLDPALVRAVHNGTAAAIRELVRQVDSPSKSVYTVQIFKPVVCQQLIEEILHAQASGLSLTRPNSMNNYGLILHEVGLARLIEGLMSDMVKPVARVLFPEWGGGSLDSLHAFTIQYSADTDRDLARHLDESDVTINLCLGTVFTGAELFFQGVRDTPSEKTENITLVHAPGTAVLHLGQHWHGAYRLHSGDRYNVIGWCRSSTARSSGAEVYAERCKGRSGSKRRWRGSKGVTNADGGLASPFTTREGSRDYEF